MSIRLTAKLVVLLFLLLWFGYRVVRPTLGQMTHGFIGYYTASYLLLGGQFGPQVYDDAWFSQQVNELVPQNIGEILTPTVPAVAWLTLPLAWLPPQLARDSWIWLNVLFLGLLLVLLPAVRPQAWQPAGRNVSLLLVAFVLLCPAVAANFRLGQGFIFFSLLHLVCVLGALKGWDGPAGASLGLGFGLKTVGLFLWLFPLVQKRWKVLGWGLAFVLGIVILGWPWIGGQVWLAYGRAILNFSGSASIAVTPYQTTAGFFSHLFRPDTLWNPAPLANLPWLATVLTILATGGALVVTGWVGRLAPAGLFLAALIPLSTILLPKAEEYHFVLLLIPAAILLAYPQKLATKPKVLLIAAIALLMLPIPYWHPALSAGWLALLAYPRLYSGWLFWLAAIYQAQALSPHKG